LSVDNKGCGNVLLDAIALTQLTASKHWRINGHAFWYVQHKCRACYMLSPNPIHLSVCHTGGSVKNGWS